MRRYLSSAVFRLADARARALLAKNHDLTRDLDAYLLKSKSTSCSYVDFAQLYETITRINPEYVLELGTGVSTIVIAHALIKNGHGKVVSMEDDEHYFKHAVEILPPHLASIVEIKFSRTVEKTYGFLRGSAYEQIPDHPYGFVFVDGPRHLTDPNGDLAFNFDLIDVIRKADSPLWAQIDARHSTCFIYHMLLGKKMRFDYVRNLGLVGPVSKDDLQNSKDLVRTAYRNHAIPRPPLFQYVRSFL